MWLPRVFPEQCQINSWEHSTVLSLLCYFNYHRPSQDFSSLEPFLMWRARITEVERDLAKSSYPNYIVPSTTHENFDEHHGFGCSLISKSGFILKSPYIIFWNVHDTCIMILWHGRRSKINLEKIACSSLFLWKFWNYQLLKSISFKKGAKKDCCTKFPENLPMSKCKQNMVFRSVQLFHRQCIFIFCPKCVTKIFLTWILWNCSIKYSGGSISYRFEIYCFISL